MPAMSTKNLPTSPLFQDLGLGNNLSQEVQNALDEEKKRRLLMGQSSQSASARDLGIMPMSNMNAA